MSLTSRELNESDAPCLHRNLFAKIPDELMRFLENEMTRRQPEGQPPVTKNAIVEEALTVHRRLVGIAVSREVGAPLSSCEAEEVRQFLVSLTVPIQPKNKPSRRRS